MQSIQNIKLKGAGNVRDFGGLKNKHGKMINPHMFLRGSVLNDISNKSVVKPKNKLYLTL